METTLLQSTIKTKCYHCGENCNNAVQINEKSFCCEGCKFVYQLLNENGLCNYYDLQEQPGIKVKGTYRSSHFAYLDNVEVQKQLIRFTDGKQSRVMFQLPQMHCASCIWLLENLHRIEPGILQSKTNFQQKEITIIYEPEKTSLRKIVELLAFVGYEPYISMSDAGGKQQKRINRTQLYKIGVAGFAFSNIMMLSFPEYFSGGSIDETTLKKGFIYLNLILSLPVLFFSASEFFISAWKGLRQKWLNIDAPIALAILVTFGRSIYEILTQTGAGYLDSMSGIVFFMLAGRWFQNKTYDSFSFDRDYTSYFPLGVTRISNHTEENIAVSQLAKEDRILVRNEEMVPADCILLSSNAAIDYSFVSGENTPVEKKKGELIYAGGKVYGTAAEMQVVTAVSKSYITQLWNNDVFSIQKNKDKSFVHPWSRYFTAMLFAVATGAAVYWAFADPSKILPAVTAVLIVACPCSLLLTVTFTYGNMLRILGKNKLYLKNAGVIEALGKIDTIVFDKTGTITCNHSSVTSFEGTPLTENERQVLTSVTRQSSHPLSKLIYNSLKSNADKSLPLLSFSELAGKGVHANVNGTVVKIGSAAFIGETDPANISHDTGTHVYVQMDQQRRGRFSFSNQYRNGLETVIASLKQQQTELHVLSGDNDAEAKNLSKIFGADTALNFRQSPGEKLQYIKQLIQKQKNVLMMGDGLNDAGALMQSNVGIAVTDNTNQFSPACDAILDGRETSKLHKFIIFAKSGKKIITGIFILSVLYNLVGLFFATQALLSPVIAAILMPVSSISIVSCAALFSNLSARAKGL